MNTVYYKRPCNCSKFYDGHKKTYALFELNAFEDLSPVPDITIDKAKFIMNEAAKYFRISSSEVVIHLIMERKLLFNSEPLKECELKYILTGFWICKDILGLDFLKEILNYPTNVNDEQNLNPVTPRVSENFEENKI